MTCDYQSTGWVVYVLNRVTCPTQWPDLSISFAIVYNNLAIDDSYFQSETVAAISDHILALYGAKLQAFTRNDPESIVIELEKVTDTSMVFIHTSPPGQTSLTGPGATCERRWV